MRKKIILSTLFVTIFVMALTSRADFLLKDWEKIKDIKLPKIDKPTYVRVPLDNEIAMTGRDFADVRVIADGKVETPYQLTVEKASREETYHSTNIIDKSVNQAGYVMFIIEFDEIGLLHDRINISVKNPNFKRNVKVYAADELLSHSSDKWWLLTDKGYIYKFTDKRANFSSGSGKVSYPVSSAKYLRVVIDSGEEGSLYVTGASVYLYEVSSAKENVFTVTGDMTENVVSKATEITIDKGARGVPAHKLELSLLSGGKNTVFNRSVVVQSSDDKKNWRRAGNGFIFDLRTPRFIGFNMAVEFPETQDRYLRVIIFNYDNSPLPVSVDVKLYSIMRTVVFEASPSSSYALYYGNDKAHAPKYDLARFFKYLEVSAMPEASLSAGRDNLGHVPPETPEKPLTERYPNLLNIVLILLVVIIAVFIFTYARNTKPEGSDKG